MNNRDFVTQPWHLAPAEDIAENSWDDCAEQLDNWFDELSSKLHDKCGRASDLVKVSSYFFMVDDNVREERTDCSEKHP